MVPHMTEISRSRGFSSKLRGRPTHKRALRVRIDCAPPASLGHSLSDPPIPKSIEFARRKAANAPAIGTRSLASPLGVVPRARCFSTRSLGSSLSLEPETVELPVVGRKTEFRVRADWAPPTSLTNSLFPGLWLALAILALASRFGGIIAVYR
jgi:hypothetical protein